MLRNPQIKRAPVLEEEPEAEAVRRALGSLQGSLRATLRVGLFLIELLGMADDAERAQKWCDGRLFFVRQGPAYGWHVHPTSGVLQPDSNAFAVPPILCLAPRGFSCAEKTDRRKDPNRRFVV